MTIDEILELMDDLLDKVESVPLSKKKSMVDTEKMREYIDSIRYNLPSEIKKAKQMVADRSSIITEANAKAEEIIKRAEERAKVIVSNEEIVKKSRETAEEMLTQAKKMDSEIRAAMSARMDKLLDDTEKLLVKNLSEVRGTRAALKEAEKK